MMSWITITWSALACACLTLATVHLLIWCKQIDRRAQTPERFGTVLRGAHLPVFCIVASMAGFVRLNFRAGRPRLGHAVCGLWRLARMINFWAGPNLNYKQITDLRRSRLFGGETVSVAEGVRSLWTRFGELSSLLLSPFVADASASLWRRVDRTQRRRALVLGGSMVLFILAAGHAALVDAGRIQSLYLISWPLLAIVGAMGYELSYGVDIGLRQALHFL